MNVDKDCRQYIEDDNSSKSTTKDNDDKSNYAQHFYKIRKLQRQCLWLRPWRKNQNTQTTTQVTPVVLIDTLG